MSDLTYEKYSGKNFVVRCDKKNKAIYGDAILTIEGSRWSSRLNGGGGWLVPLDKEVVLQQVISQFVQQKAPSTNVLDEMKERAKPRQSQKKYHRAMSEDEYTGDDEEETKEDKTVTAENASIEEMFHPKTDSKMLDYYKKFTKNPRSRSPSRSDDSSNKFPSPASKPGKKKKRLVVSFSSSSSSSGGGSSRKDMKKVVKQVKYLRSKIKNMEKSMK